MPFGENKINIPVFRMYPSGHSEILVGTYALQEAHAYYIQKIIESEIKTFKKNIKFKTPADALPKYPYKFVDYLFDLFNLDSTDYIKVYITELCLDTFLPMVTMIKVLEILKDRGMVTDKNQLFEIVSQALAFLKIPLAINIQDIMVEFLKGLIVDDSRPFLNDGIKWYLETINEMRKLRNIRAYWIHEGLTTLNHIKGFMTFYQPPVVIINNQISYFKYNIKKSRNSQDILDSVTALFLNMHVFEFTTELNRKKFNKLVCCPLYENCQIRKDIKSEYVCTRRPWTISEHHKEKGKACFYRKGLMELGLDQNKIEVDPSLFTKEVS
jgi:hypothetical protein